MKDIKCFLAPDSSGPRDVPRCGALNSLQKTLYYRGGPSETAATLNGTAWMGGGRFAYSRRIISIHCLLHFHHFFLKRFSCVQKDDPRLLCFIAQVANPDVTTALVVGFLSRPFESRRRTKFVRISTSLFVAAGCTVPFAVVSACSAKNSRFAELASSFDVAYKVKPSGTVGSGGGGRRVPHMLHAK